MTFRSQLIAGFAAAAVLGAAAPSQAQYYVQTYTPPPLYPYVVQPQPYGQVQTYTQPQSYPQSYPYVIQRQPQARHISRNRVRTKTDHALVQELRRKSGKNMSGKKLPKIDRTVVVREKPVVVEQQRVVEEPPVVIERHRTVDVAVPPRARRKGEKRDMLTVPTNQGEAGRVIRAEAEVTIQGPDRMTIQLFRKRGGNASAKAE